jgi:DNA mismatch endonuclease (patch repair protein)
MMANIAVSNTMPEMMIRKELFSRGFRYRINVSNLPGKPDIVLKKFKVVIFINGCFWHQHECPKGKLPSTNREFWEMKLSRNKIRDKNNIRHLVSLGWRICTIWECSITNSRKFENELIPKVIKFFLSVQKELEV